MKNVHTKINQWETHIKQRKQIQMKMYAIQFTLLIPEVIKM